MLSIRNLKKILPSSLFIRFLLIIIIPTILAQVFATYIFYERHWRNVSGNMIKNLSGEIALVTKLHLAKQDSKETLSLIHKELNLNVDYQPIKFIIKKLNSDEEISNLHYKLNERLNLPVNVNFTNKKTNVKIEIGLSDGTLTIITSRRKIDNPTTYIFILWMVGAASIFSILAILFLRSQTRSITNLAIAAENFGRGKSIEKFKPSGADEVRKAGIAFIRMKDRIERQMIQRTIMLAAVSHDLRTPLTRIKLELSMFEQNEQISDIKNDLSEMEKTINYYLDFARGEGTENFQLMNINNIVKSIIENYKVDNDITLESNGEYEISIKENAFRRVITNLIDNSLKYANSDIKIILSSLNETLTIAICDYGPGISDIEKKLVFKPFYKVDNSRNDNGIGIGLSIVKDIISSHGGNVELQDNDPTTGLKFIINLPYN